AIERSIRDTVVAARAWQRRRSELDKFLFTQRLRITEDEPGTAELNATVPALEDLAQSHLAELGRLRSAVDDRKHPLTGHARVRLSTHVQAVVGRYEDPVVLTVLNDLLENRGELPIGHDALRG